MNIYLHWLTDSSILNCPNAVSDYQIDCVYHGLVDSGYHFSSNVYPWWMHKSNKEHPREQYSQIWGKGFTLYGLLNDRIGSQIKPDIAIIGIHHTANHQDKLLCEIINELNKKDIKTLVLDGWDNPYICNEAVTLADKYFKRELDPTTPLIGEKVFPISFAIPEQHIIDPDKYSYKAKGFAEMIPAMQSWGDHQHLKSYKYTSEKEYYQDYQHSYFAYTCCKAGYDCLRHYEIIANGCIPWFTDIEKCPKTILTTFPKNICIDAKKIRGINPGTTIPYNPDIDTYLGDTRLIKPGWERGNILSNFDYTKYHKTRDTLLKYAKEHLTTKALVKYILST